MSTLILKDGATLFYKDWGTGQPIVFSHGWPLTADETDFTEDLEKIDIPVLIMHGDDDQIVPIGASAKLIRNSTLKVYPGYPHGMATTHPEVINSDLLAFFRS